MRFPKTKAIALFLTAVILVIIIFAGPVQSFITGFTISNLFPSLGEKISLVVSAEVESDEILDIKNFTLKLSGPSEYSCIFDTNGTLLSSCPGISISVISVPNYTFGYGFLPGILKYNVTLNTSVLQRGTYDTMLTVTLPSEEIETPQQQITILDGGVEVNTCSLRAKSGDATFEDDDYGSKNKLSLFVPSKGAKKGQGTIISGTGRDRVSYSFDVLEATIIDANTMIFEITGDLRVGREDSLTENAIIAYRTNTMEIDVSGDSLDIENMDVNFAKC